MPIMNKLPLGGGASEVGISDGKGIVGLNLFTQMDEPTKKDGIWIKTNHTYQNVMINQQYANYQDGVFSKYCDISIKVLSLVQNQGIIYIYDERRY